MWPKDPFLTGLWSQGIVLTVNLSFISHAFSLSHVHIYSPVLPFKSTLPRISIVDWMQLQGISALRKCESMLIQDMLISARSLSGMPLILEQMKENYCSKLSVRCFYLVNGPLEILRLVFCQEGLMLRSIYIWRSLPNTILCAYTCIEFWSTLGG